MSNLKINNYQILSKILNQGRLEEFFFSVQSYIKGDEKPDPVIYNLIGIYFYKKREFENSIEYFDKSLKEKKVYQVLANKASSFIALKLYSNALDIYEELILINDKIPAGYIGKSNVYLLLEDINKSELALKDGLKVIKNNFELTYSLAKLKFIKKDVLEAITLFKSCVSISGKQSDLLNRIALCYEEIDDTDEAIKYYLNSLSINESHIDTLYNLGNLYRALGNFKKAKTVYENILDKFPYAHEIHRYYSIVHKYTSPKDTHLVKMISIIQSENFIKNESKYHQIYFALSKAYEDIGNYEESVNYLIKGNALRRKTVRFNNFDIASKHFETQKNIFKDLNFKKNTGSKSNLPIFIVGMPRSGTTLVEQIISSHSEVYSGGEMIFISQAIKKFFPETDLIKFNNQVKDKIQYCAGEMADFYISKVMHKIKNNEKYITDKLPNNFTFIGFIKCMFPNAKIIYCKRNAKANCMSIYKNYFPDNGIWFAYDISELKKFYKLHLDYMNLWMEIFPGEIYTLNYEDLVNKQEIESRKLIDYCDLKWEESCLRFYENTAKVSTLSTSQVRNPIYKSSLSQFDYYKKLLPKLFEGL